MKESSELLRKFEEVYEAEEKLSLTTMDFFVGDYPSPDMETHKMPLPSLRLPTFYTSLIINHPKPENFNLKKGLILSALFTQCLSLGATAAPEGCLSPLQYGAIPNDGQDDRAALQATVDAAVSSGQDVCIPAGLFHLTRIPLPGATNIGSLKIRGKVRVSGEGSEVTKLMMLGSAILPNGTAPADWRLIDIREGASEVYVSDMSLEGGGRFNTGEQTHLLHMNGPVNGVTAERLNLLLPSLNVPTDAVPCPTSSGKPPGAYCHSVTGAFVGFFSGGDCVRMLGDTTAMVRNVALRGINAPNCDRAAFSLQRGLDNILIEDSYGACYSDQALDFEPTGGVGLSNITIRRVNLDRGGADGQGYTATAGANGATADNLLLEDVNISGGGLLLSEVNGLTLRRVNVNSGTVSTSPTLHIRMRALGVVIEDSTFTRPAGAPPLSLVYIHHQSGLGPNDVTFNGSVLNQNTISSFLSAESLKKLYMNRTELNYGGGVTPVNFPVIQNRGLLNSLDEVVLSGIRVSTPPMVKSFEGLLRLSASSTLSKGRGVITDSTVNGLRTYGLRYESGINSSLPTVLTNNFWDAPLACQGSGC